jgi:hypothetical protein
LPVVAELVPLGTERLVSSECEWQPHHSSRLVDLVMLQRSHDQHEDYGSRDPRASIPYVRAVGRLACPAADLDLDSQPSSSTSLDIARDQAGKDFIAEATVWFERCSSCKTSRSRS